jgi:hypothetical protein
VGLPVLNKNVSAHAVIPRHTINVKAAPIKLPLDTTLLLFVSNK